MPTLTSIQEVMQRLIRRLDHRWKRDDELPETAETHTFLRSQAIQSAELWELLSDIRTLNDLERVTGFPLDLEADDLKLRRRPRWTDEDLLWWIKLHLLLYVSGGTIPQIKQLVSYLLRRNITDADKVLIYQNKCLICDYQEPAFYTVQFPVSWLTPESGYFMFDPNDGDILNTSNIHGWDHGLWGDEPEEMILRLLRFLSRATAAGVRINAECYGGLMFDPNDNDILHGSIEYGWASDNTGGVWNGAIVEAVQDYGIEQLELDRYHFCWPGAKDWEEIAIPGHPFVPQGLMFDAFDDDTPRISLIHGWDYAVWLDNTEP